MSFQIEISDAASNDTRKAFLWYEEKSPTLGLRFENDFKQAIDLIRDNPHKFQVRYKDMHIVFLNHFPFGVHYFIKDSTVVILAVFHTSQNPATWPTRKVD